MSQHKLNITPSDATSGTEVIAQLNAALQALASLQSGTAALAATYPYQLRIDTSPLPDADAIIYARLANNLAEVAIGYVDRATGKFVLNSLLGIANEFTANQKLKGDALLWRFKDTGASGKEWAIRSDGGNLEICENTGTEGAPTWTVRKTISSTPTAEFDALAPTTTRGDLIFRGALSNERLAKVNEGDMLRMGSADPAWSVDAPLNTQSGTSYTLVLSDAHKTIYCTSGSAVTLTVPPNSSVAFAVGTRIDVIQAGAGKVSLAQGAGVTISSKNSNKALGAQHVGATLKKTGTDTWVLMGDLIA